MNTELKILLVEDSDSDADLLLRFLKKEKIEFSHSRVWDKDAFEKALRDDHHDLIISDQSMPQFSGMEAFRISKQQNKNIPFILITGTVSETILSEFAKEGIDDYMLKENLLRLPSAIKHIITSKKIELLHKKLETAHKDINDSIHYAKKIQNAMLPDTTLLKDNFPESFILFKPKDVLSGDFYWLKKDENTFFVAAADCTGHGIPGALMSMIGIEKLNNVSIETKQPSQILNRLDESIGVALFQSIGHEQCNDGMDIALCAIDNETGMLHYAGANRPLWIIRMGSGEVEEIKATKKAIGGLATLIHPDFENHEIQLQKGDTVYLTSDGFADQFGGIKDKKLTTKKFKQLLIGIQELIMSEQKIYIDDFMNGWKAETEQVDDILVIGVRY